MAYKKGENLPTQTCHLTYKPVTWHVVLQGSEYRNMSQMNPVNPPHPIPVPFISQLEATPDGAVERKYGVNILT